MGAVGSFIGSIAGSTVFRSIASFVAKPIVKAATRWIGSALLAGSAAKKVHDVKKEAKKTAEDANAKLAAANKAKYDAAAEKRRAAMAEAEANKRRVMDETNTVKTTALGNTGGTQTQKKTLLGG